MMAGLTPGHFHVGHAARSALPRQFSLPLVGRGRGGGHHHKPRRIRISKTNEGPAGGKTPTPAPPHKGEGNHTLTAVIPAKAGIPLCLRQSREPS